MSVESKINEAITILKTLGLPSDQQNERSALTLLALLNLSPAMSWQKISKPMLGVTPIMDWVREVYKKDYAPNSRETFRRYTLHQFIAAGICLYNPDEPDRPVNSPKACYQISGLAYDTIVNFKTNDWNQSVQDFFQKQESLIKQYAKVREMEMIPVNLGSKTVKLTAGKHHQLIRDIIEEFGARFAPASKVIYIGDTGQKEQFFEVEELERLGVKVDKHGKWPDVILYAPEKNWLYLIESVTSHGPMDSKRVSELKSLFQNSTAGLVYISAFPDRKTMNRFLKDISWETEVWVADAPSHMIHFNGDRFMGPHE